MYESCRFHVQGKIIALGDYSLEQFKKCLECKHFRTRCEDYSCWHSNGIECLLEIKSHFEKKGS
jgi:hypothetical protein